MSEKVGGKRRGLITLSLVISQNWRYSLIYVIFLVMHMFIYILSITCVFYLILVFQQFSFHGKRVNIYIPIYILAYFVFQFILHTTNVKHSTNYFFLTLSSLFILRFIILIVACNQKNFIVISYCFIEFKYHHW